MVGEAAITAPFALSFRQVGAHLWHRGPVFSRKQRDSNPGPSTLARLRQALYSTELPPTLSKTNWPLNLMW